MRRSLLFKLILCYIITVSALFMIANTLGSVFIKDQIGKKIYEQLYNTNKNIATGPVINRYFQLASDEPISDISPDSDDDKDNSDAKNNDEKKAKDKKDESKENQDSALNHIYSKDAHVSDETLESYLASISEAVNYNIWLLDKDGNFVYSSEKLDAKNVKDYNKRFFYLNNADIITIKELVDTPSIFTIYPLKTVTTDYGYLVLHTPAEAIDIRLADIMPYVNIALGITSLIIAIIFILIYFLAIHPINKITKYAIEATQGKINQKINIGSNDEYKDLSNALFYLTSELNNIDEYQRKFISNISHDFRSPLTSIKGYLEAMLDGTIPPENYEKYIKTILFESERLTELTTNLLTLNQLDNTKQILNKTNFDINYIIKKTIDVYEGRCTKNKISLEMNFESDSLSVYADQAKIQQVINNILDNAIKFSPHNSSIVLSTYVKSEKAFISIKDHGQGIPKDSISHIWERFYKTDASRGKDKKGTGLGLSITKEIINAHHENINVTSTVGVGTEFCFSLPKSKS